MITARDVMTESVTTVKEDLSIGKFVKLVQKKHFIGCPVVDKEGRAIGLVSQNDVLRVLAHLSGAAQLQKNFAGTKRIPPSLKKGGKGVPIGKFLDLPVKEIMTACVEGCAPDTPAAQICETMTSKKIHRVIVLDGEGKVAGLISATDLVRKYGEALKQG